MVSFRQLLALLMLTLVSISSSLAEVTATIDRNPIHANETFNLTINTQTAVETKPVFPNLPPQLIEKGARSFFNSSTINGVTKISAGWIFNFQAIEAGIYTIPAIEVNGERTEPLQIQVKPAVSATNINGQQNAIFLTAEVDKKKVYVQEQVLYTLKLYRAVQAQYATLSEPAMPGALIERLGDELQFETIIDNVRYAVLERKYVIFPQEAGKFEISEVVFNAEVSDGSRRYSTLGRLRSNTRPISLTTPALNIEVMPKPAQVPNWWLPAKDVKLTETWTPDANNFRVGEPMTWSIKIEALGLSATQLPELNPETVAGFKFYPDAPSSSSVPVGDNIKGTRLQKLAVLPTAAGEFELPEIKLTWWDVTNDQLQELTIPKRTVTVLPELGAATTTELPAEPNQQPALPPKQTTQPQEPQEQPKQPAGLSDMTSDESSEALANEKTNPQTAIIWYSLTALFALLWLLTLAIYLKTKKQLQQGEKISQTEPSPTLDSAKAKQHLANVKASCKANDAQTLKAELLAFCQVHSATQHINAIGTLANALGDGELSSQLQQLEAYLYAANKQQPDYQVIMRNLEQLKQLHKKQQESKREGLAPLHLSD